MLLLFREASARGRAIGKEDDYAIALAYLARAEWRDSGGQQNGDFGVRSGTDTSMMFMNPLSPRLSAAIAPSRAVWGIRAKLNRIPG